eukprot:1182405-Prorocentrum_minimum.AAC.1
MSHEQGERKAYWAEGLLSENGHVGGAPSKDCWLEECSPHLVPSSSRNHLCVHICHAELLRRGPRATHLSRRYGSPGSGEHASYRRACILYMYIIYMYIRGSYYLVPGGYKTLKRKTQKPLTTSITRGERAVGGRAGARWRWRWRWRA